MQPGLAPVLLDDPMDIDEDDVDPPPALEPSLVDHMDALWASLDVNDKRALRLCCTAMRGAVDARASSLEASDVLLSPATCARLSCANTLTLRSMATLRTMLVAPPKPGSFPALRSLRLILHEGGVEIGDLDYWAITSFFAAPWLTQLSVKLPVNATALPQQMASLLAACSRLEEVALHGDWYETPQLVDIVALSAGTHLLRLRLPGDSRLADIATLSALVNLQSLDIRDCTRVTDLAPLSDLVKLRSLRMQRCRRVSDLAPLSAMVTLQTLDMTSCNAVSDLVPIRDLVDLRSLFMSRCVGVSDLAPLAAMVNLTSLNLCDCYGP
ncbi:hypothetical protein FOA52_002469 [Chlamydomonas sp. UWO 241]|nr:hypothetical protein FOA52_002469 [Chlamydomonas sp. UWO 241]